MKVILIKAGEKTEVIEKEGETLDYTIIKQLLNIDNSATVVTRKIGNEYYDLWIDDEGLLKEEKIVSGFLVDGRNEEILVGNLLITKSNKKGESLGLSNADIKNIMNSRHMVDMDKFNKIQKQNADHDVYVKHSSCGQCVIKAHSNWLIYEL